MANNIFGAVVSLRVIFTEQDNFSINEIKSYRDTDLPFVIA